MMTELDIITLKINPVAKPRMTRQDKWMKRPCVVRYRAYCDELCKQARKQNLTSLPDSLRVGFAIPMPVSWSKKKRLTMEGMPHQQKPDIDNLVKGVMDAMSKDDANVYELEAEKWWDVEGAVVVQIEKPIP